MMLRFGTGGVRALMGDGEDRLNVHAIRAITQALAAHIGHGSVVIGYDVRHNSRLFAEETARVLAGNQIKAFLSPFIIPTPVISFACRHLQARGAVMITASHNPPDYNGYKVYGPDGAQLIAPDDAAIEKNLQEKRPIALSPLSSPLIEELDIKEIYLNHLKGLNLPSYPLSICYTPLHGTGMPYVPEALSLLGFSSPHIVQEQKEPDPLFSHAKSPNPEEAKALELGMRILEKEKFDLLLATDPDADRLGIAVLHQGKGARLSGNEMAAVALDAFLSLRKRQGRLPHNGSIIKTFVTTPLLRKIAESYGVATFDVATGFKNIAALIRTWDKTHAHAFLFGAEESLGLLFDLDVRDKDGIAAACLIASIAGALKQKGLTLIDHLHGLYELHGVFRERQLSLPSNPAFLSLFEGDHLPAIGPFAIEKREKKGGSPFFTLDGGRLSLLVRPSGTEPKVKLYLFAQDISSLSEADEKLLLLEKGLMKLLS